MSNETSLQDINSIFIIDDSGLKLPPCTINIHKRNTLSEYEKLPRAMLVRIVLHYSALYL